MNNQNDIDQKKENQNHISTKQIWLGILLVALLVGGFFVADIVSSWRKEKVTNKDLGDKIDKIEKTLSPYEAKNKLNKTTIVSDFENTVKNNNPTQSFKKTLKTTGSFAGGYLYIRASVNAKPLDGLGDVYIKLSGFVNGKYQESGGHLISGKSLDTPKLENATELLFDLSDVKYKDTYLKSDIEVVSGDWLKIMNGSGVDIVIGFTSTEEVGKIEEISLYSGCNEGSECSISTP